MIAAHRRVVYVVNRCLIHGVLFNSANCMASVLIFCLSAAAVWLGGCF